MLPAGRVSQIANNTFGERRFLLKHRGSMGEKRKTSNNSLHRWRKASNPITEFSLDHARSLPVGFLRLNIGGQSFRLLTHSLVHGVLRDFAALEHSSRLALCDGFIPETEEYFFQRSALLFDGIYQFYVSGQCHRPPGVCLDQFSAELDFWGLTELQLSSCCWNLNLRDTAEPTDTQQSEIDPFENIRFAGMRRKAWNLIEEPRSSVLARIFSGITIVAILMSNSALVLGSLDAFKIKTITKIRDNDSFNNQTKWVVIEDAHPALKYMELVCIIWFTIEYVGRLLVAPNRRKVACMTMNIIDLIAIVPFYLEIGLYLVGLSSAKMQEFKAALLVVRILRVLRVVRLFKLSRYSTGLQTFARTLKRSKEQLGMLVVVLATGIMFFSTLVYYLEKDEPGTKFQSIPSSFWWCIVTMTTVGYGDMFPETTPGKLVGSCCIASGILVLALPLTVIVENFMQVQDELRQAKLTQVESYMNAMADKWPMSPGSHRMSLFIKRSPQPSPLSRHRLSLFA